MAAKKHPSEINQCSNTIRDENHKNNMKACKTLETTQNYTKPHWTVIVTNKNFFIRNAGTLAQAFRM